MSRKDFLAIILIFLSPFPFFSNKCLALFSTRFMKKTSKDITQAYLYDICIFRVRQFKSALLTTILFGIALILAHFWFELNFSKILWKTVIATILLTHTVFNQLGWKLRWGDDNLLLEKMNEWAFRIIYSIGIILMFLTLMH